MSGVLLSRHIPTDSLSLSMTAASSCEKLSGRKKERKRRRKADRTNGMKVDRAFEERCFVRCPRFVEGRQNRDTSYGGER